jgi:hypothetical protein
MSPKRVVDLVDNVRGAKDAAVEAAAIETLQGLLSPRERVELDIDFPVCIGIDCDMNDVAVLLVALSLDLNLKIFDPVGAVQP